MLPPHEKANSHDFSQPLLAVATDPQTAVHPPPITLNGSCSVVATIIMAHPFRMNIPLPSLLLLALACPAVALTPRVVTSEPTAPTPVIWSIGNRDQSPDEFALAPDGFADFVGRDFGYEDKFFVIGHSDAGTDLPYVLPGPVDTWGGTWPTSGWRINEVTILFTLESLAEDSEARLVIELVDHAKTFLPLVKVYLNDQGHRLPLEAPGYDRAAQRSPRLDEPQVQVEALRGDRSAATPQTLSIPVPQHVLRPGGNQVKITIYEGSWIMFDQIRLEGTGLTLGKPDQVFLRRVRPAPYQLETADGPVQPLLVHVEHLTGEPRLAVRLDGELIGEQTLERGPYDFEFPMPAVARAVVSRYEILVDGRTVERGTVERARQRTQTLADYVDTRIGTAHSRWMIAPGPWMPFSMVKLSPDNQNAGWQAGYQPSFESIGTFSHIHEWTLGGLGIFPTNGRLVTEVGDELKPDSGYRSRFCRSTEEAPIGYYAVRLEDYDIRAELTATTRCGMFRFTFPEDREGARILIDLHIPTEYDYRLSEVRVHRISDYRLEGFSHQFAGRVWSHDADQDYTLHFVIEFDQPMASMGGWIEDRITGGNTLHATNVADAGVFVQFDPRQHPVVHVRTGISLVSIANAALNLETELSGPFGWDFAAVRRSQVAVWNDLFNRTRITTPNRLEKLRFYNAVYRSVCSRNTWSDVNGQWRGTDGEIHTLAHPDHVALGCDAFWNTFWNLNQYWNLVLPEWSSRWVNSQLAMYDAYGWLAKGPAGMNFIPVMVAEHEIPMIVGAYQMGIRDFDARQALVAAVKMQTTPAQKVHSGFAGNRDLVPYLKHGYVPYDQGRFSNSFEYSFDDWAVGQLALALGDQEIHQHFHRRGGWWRNAISETGYAHMRHSDGSWLENFDPFRSGANHHYVEANAWQMTYFVPQDVPALVEVIGRERFLERLDWGFAASDPWRYNGMNDQYWDYPVVQGNQQSMHFAFLFNWAGKPWLTQKWSRAIIERFYGYGVGNAYLGDEDQGQLSAWLVMAKLGLFQTDGGCRVDPIYEIGSPLYERVEIELGGRYGRGQQFVIEARGVSRKNLYVQQATLNGRPWRSFHLPATELLQGGSLVLEMGPEPNRDWGRQD
jgi:predicted alpha-1,2-mannosidase